MLDHERIRLVISSSLRLLSFPPFHLPALCLASQRGGCSWASWHEAEQSGSHLHNHHMPSHLFSCHHGCSRGIKRQFKNDWTMTHDTPAIGRTTAFCIPLCCSHFVSLSLSLSLFLSVSASLSFRCPLPFFLFQGEEEAREESSRDPLTSVRICQSASPSGPAQ